VHKELNCRALMTLHPSTNYFVYSCHWSGPVFHLDHQPCVLLILQMYGNGFLRTVYLPARRRTLPKGPPDPTCAPTTWVRGICRRLLLLNSHLSFCIRSVQLRVWRVRTSSVISTSCMFMSFLLPFDTPCDRVHSTLEWNLGQGLIHLKRVPLVGKEWVSEKTLLSATCWLLISYHG